MPPFGEPHGFAGCLECRYQVEPATASLRVAEGGTSADPAEIAGRYGPETPVPDWHKWLVCYRCGSQDSDMVVEVDPENETDDADHDLLVSHCPPNRFEIAGARGARFEGQRVGIDLIERLQSRLVALHVAEDALLGRVAPAGVAPHLGLAAQPFDRVVEYLDQLGDFDTAERLAACRHMWICGSSIWITGQPASASALSS